MAVLLLALPPVYGADAPRGRLTGGIQYELPNWFKKSFLILKEDLEEASQGGRHLMVFNHLEECPYCARLLDENFRQGETKEFTEEHFDVIGIDIRGGKNVEWFDGTTYTEQQVARNLKIKATPTIVFFDRKPCPSSPDQSGERKSVVQDF